jgi:hypothetical protein
MNSAIDQTLLTASTAVAWTDHEEAARLKRLWALLGLFSLYAAALLIVVLVSDGADVGCILGGIAGHVLYATHRIVASWRDAAWLEDAKVRVSMRLPHPSSIRRPLR